MRILGVDPGLIRTGYGIIDAKDYSNLKLVEAGIVKTSSKDNISARLKDIYNNLTDIVKEYKPEIIVLEKIYSHYKHPATAILMGHARGTVCLLSGISNIPLINYPATRIKKAVTGSGRATKEQVQLTVKALLNLKATPKTFDMSDALAIAISYVYIERIGD